MSIYLVEKSFLSIKKFGKSVLFTLNVLLIVLIKIKIIIIVMMKKNYSNNYEKSIYDQIIVENRSLVEEPLSENFFVSRFYWPYIECS